MYCNGMYGMVCIVFYNVYCMHRILFFLWCDMYCIYCTVCRYCMYCMLCIYCIVYCVLCIVYCVVLYDTVLCGVDCLVYIVL